MACPVSLECWGKLQQNSITSLLLNGMSSCSLFYPKIHYRLLPQLLNSQGSSLKTFHSCNLAEEGDSYIKDREGEGPIIAEQETMTTQETLAEAAGTKEEWH